MLDISQSSGVHCLLWLSSDVVIHRLLWELILVNDVRRVLGQATLDRSKLQSEEHLFKLVRQVVERLGAGSHNPGLVVRVQFVLAQSNDRLHLLKDLAELLMLIIKLKEFLELGLVEKYDDLFVVDFVEFLVKSRKCSVVLRNQRDLLVDLSVGQEHGMLQVQDQWGKLFVGFLDLGEGCHDVLS